MNPPEDYLVPTDEDIDREKIVLAGLMREAKHIPEVHGVLNAEDFIGGERGLNSRIYQAILEAHEQNRAASLVDIKAVLDSLERILAQAEDLHHHGGKKQLAVELGHILEADPTGMWCQYYTGKVKEFSVRRKLEIAARKILFELTNPSTSTDELIADAQKEINAFTLTRTFGNVVSLKSAIVEAQNEIDQAREGQMSGITWGIPKLDFLTDGLQNSELVLIGARPSVGKSAFGVMIARAAAESGHKVLFFSLEQATRELTFRLLSGETGISAIVMRRGKMNANSVNATRNAAYKLADLPIWFNDFPRQTPASLLSGCRKAKAKIDVNLIIVDYVQLMHANDKRADDRERVSAASRALKLLARELNIPVVAMAQLNRKQEDREHEEPKLSDFKDSGSLEQDADVAVLLHRPEKPIQEAPTQLISAKLAKQRNGPTGAVLLEYVKASGRFLEAAKEKP